MILKDGCTADEAIALVGVASSCTCTLWSRRDYYRRRDMEVECFFFFSFEDLRHPAWCVVVKGTGVRTCSAASKSRLHRLAS